MSFVSPARPLERNRLAHLGAGTTFDSARSPRGAPGASTGERPSRSTTSRGHPADSSHARKQRRSRALGPRSSRSASSSLQACRIGPPPAARVDHCEPGEVRPRRSLFGRRPREPVTATAEPPDHAVDDARIRLRLRDGHPYERHTVEPEPNDRTVSIAVPVGADRREPAAVACERPPLVSDPRFVQSRRAAPPRAVRAAAVVTSANKVKRTMESAVIRMSSKLGSVAHARLTQRSHDVRGRAVRAARTAQAAR